MKLKNDIKELQGYMNDDTFYGSMYSGNVEKPRKPYVEPPPEVERFESIEKISHVQARIDLIKFRNQVSQIAKIITEVGHIPLYPKFFTEARRGQCFGSDEWSVDYHQYMIYAVDTDYVQHIDVWKYRNSHVSSCLTFHGEIRFPFTGETRKSFWSSWDMSVFRHNANIKHDAERIDYSTHGLSILLSSSKIAKAIELLKTEYEYVRLTKNVDDYLKSNNIEV